MMAHKGMEGQEKESAESAAAAKKKKEKSPSSPELDLSPRKPKSALPQLDLRSEEDILSSLDKYRPGHYSNLTGEGASGSSDINDIREGGIKRGHGS